MPGNGPEAPLAAVPGGRAGSSARTGMVVLIGALYLLCVPYLAFFTWFWFID